LLAPSGVLVTAQRGAGRSTLLKAIAARCEEDYGCCIHQIYLMTIIIIIIAVGVVIVFSMLLGQDDGF